MVWDTLGAGVPGAKIEGYDLYARDRGCGRGAGHVVPVVTDSVGEFFTSWGNPFSGLPGGITYGCLRMWVTPPEGSGLAGVEDTVWTHFYDRTHPGYQMDTLKAEFVLPPLPDP